MPRIPVIKAKDFHKCLLDYGCVGVRVKGSHHRVFNPRTNKYSTVAIHGGDDLDKGSFSGVLNQLDIDPDDFLDFIKR